MKNSKSDYLDKIIIYQMTLLDKLAGVFSALLLVAFSIECLILDFEYKLGMTILLLLFMIVYCVFIYFDIFKTYVCLDIPNNKLIIREMPGVKKEEIFLDNIISLTVSDGIYAKECFTFDVNMHGYTKKIDSWSVPPSSKISIFSGRKGQRKRLEKFCEECNQYLNNRTNNCMISTANLLIRGFVFFLSFFP